MADDSQDQLNNGRNSSNNGIAFFKIGTLGWGIFVTASVFLGLGFLGIYLPRWFNWPNNSLKTELSINVGTAFFASAILTCTLELASQAQRRKDFYNTMEKVDEKIQKIREASVDQLLEDLAGDKLIFQEIKSQIIKKNYIRRNFQYEIRFNWLDEHKTYLQKEQTAKYIITNLAARPVTYDLQVIEEREYCDLPTYKDQDDNTKITKVNYRIFSGEITKESKNFKEQEIQKNVKEQEEKSPKKLDEKVYDLVSFKKELTIPENHGVEIETKVDSIVESQLRYPLISLVNSTGLEINVTYHPDDLIVACYPIHPHFDKLELLIKDVCTKRWSIQSGLFPGQGVQLEWKRKNSESLENKKTQT